MPSTEFLLYLVIVIFVVYVIINYYRDTTAEPEIQYKYIPVYNDKPSQKQDQNQQSSISDQSYNGFYSPMAGSPIGPLVPSGPPAGPGMPPIDPLRKFDYDVIEDDFTPPFRRSYYDDNNYRLAPGLYPAYTRGPPGRFRKVGTLIAETHGSDPVPASDKFKFLMLMGRQKYSNRDYEYFVTSPDSDQKLKFYIDTHGREINDGDTVTIAELNGYTFVFKEDPDLSPKYDPYMI